MIEDSDSNQTVSFYDGIVDVFNEKAVFFKDVISIFCNIFHLL
jgi:hypothetical protein